MLSTGSSLDEWLDTPGRDQLAHDLKKLYQLQGAFLFRQYEPVNASPADAGIPFLARLEKWLGGFNDPEDRWAAFLSLRYFFFVGQQETDELYRCAVQHELLPWLSDLAGLDIFDAQFSSQLDAEIKKCWACPVTDSLRINSLLHRTGLAGQDLRPDWLSLRTLGNCVRIEKYVSKQDLKYLVLFEDFVGSGRQCCRVAKFALRAFKGPILLIPLVVCHPGNEVLKNLAATTNGRLSYRPIVTLSEDCLVRKVKHPDEPNTFANLRIAMKNGYDISKLQLKGEEYGYDGVGSLFASYSNCPNNSPPIFHAKSDTWQHPLFPRKART